MTDPDQPPLQEDPVRDKPSVLRENDDGARSLARGLMRTARFAALATLEPDGHPAASLVSLATDSDGAGLVLVSSLSGHTGNMARDKRVSLLVGQPGKGDPLAHPRMTIFAWAANLDRGSEPGERARRRFLSRHPKAVLYADFGDFSFWRLVPIRASLNGGFGKAFELAPSDVLTPIDGADALITSEPGAIEHMNADHADAVRLYATKLCGAPDGPWRVTGIDPHGLDLMLGDRAERVVFPQLVQDGAALRRVLVELANHARQRTSAASSNA